MIMATAVRCPAESDIGTSLTLNLSVMLYMLLQCVRYDN